MYMPTGGIWVTLETLDWGWSASAMRDPRTGWSLLGAPSLPPSTTNGKNSNTPPQWDDYGTDRDIDKWI